MKSTPVRSREIVPETVCLQAVGASRIEFTQCVVTACLLKNEPASLRCVARLTRVGKP